MVLGAGLAVALIVGMQLPLLHPRSHSKVTLAALSNARPVSPLAWPVVGSAALVIPSLGVERAWHNSVEPIASLTKLMTAYVTLKELPLGLDQTGPCMVVSSSDVATYEQMKLTDQSSVLVSAGESICEIDLLNGLLVHSASNYAVLLANMVAVPITALLIMPAGLLSLPLMPLHAEALALVHDDAERRLLERRLTELGTTGPASHDPGAVG